MDFSKLNLEFANMQKTINEYNLIISRINNKIKDNLKIISRMENKLKNTKNKIEKNLINFCIKTIKDENDFLENLIKEESSNESKSKDIIKI